MKKWIITWDIGYGQGAGIVLAETHEQASMEAYEWAREEFESNANYEAVPYNEELAQDLDLVELPDA